MPKTIVIKRTLTWTVEVPFNDEYYPDMLEEDIIEEEQDRPVNFLIDELTDEYEAATNMIKSQTEVTFK